VGGREVRVGSAAALLEQRAEPGDFRRAIERSERTELVERLPRELEAAEVGREIHDPLARGSRLLDVLAAIEPANERKRLRALPEQDLRHLEHHLAGLADCGAPHASIILVAGKREIAPQVATVRF